MANQAEQILCYENYCALAVSILSPRLICPELAFERMGMNRFTDRQDIKRYRWTVNGDKLWRDMGAIKELGWTWGEIGDYFGMSYNTAITIYCRNRKWHTGRNGGKNPDFGRRKNNADNG